MKKIITIILIFISGIIYAQAPIYKTVTAALDSTNNLFRSGTFTLDLNAKFQKLSDGIVSGLVPTATGNNLSITAGTYRLNHIIQTASARTFSNIPLSASGLQRILVVFGNTSGVLDTLSGAQSSNPVTPILPANTIRLAFTPVTSTTVVPPSQDLSGYAKLNGGNDFTGDQYFDTDITIRKNRFIGLFGKGLYSTGIGSRPNGINDGEILYFQTNGFPQISLFKSGNLNLVPFGSTDSGYKLNVGGDINTTGVFRVNGTPISKGTVTSITAGLGLTGETVTTSGTLAVDTAVVRTVANSLTKAQTQTALNTKQNNFIGLTTNRLLKATSATTVDVSNLIENSPTSMQFGTDFSDNARTFEIRANTFAQFGFRNSTNSYSMGIRNGGNFGFTNGVNNAVVILLGSTANSNAINISGNGTGNIISLNTGNDGVTLINTFTNNNVDKLQVNGTASASPATLSNQLVTKSQLDLKIDLSEKGLASGVASLNSSGKVPLSQINDVLLGAVNYKGTYDASTNTPALPSATTNKGNYYIASTAGTQFSLTLAIGDWIISNGTDYGKVDNNNSVTSVAGRTGAVVLTKSDVGLSNVPNLSFSGSNTGDQDLSGKANIESPAFTGTVSGITKSMVGLANVDNTSDADKPISTATQTALNEKIAGTGTTNQIAKFTASGAVGNSIIQDLGNNITINGGEGADVLTLKKSSGASIAIEGATGTTQPIAFSATNTTTPDLQLFIGGSEKVRVLSNGNVGIGTTTPTERLDVVGNGKFSGSVTAPTFVGALQGNAANASQLNGQAASFYTDIVARLGYTPYSSANPSGYITSAALSPYALTSGLGASAYTAENLQSVTGRGFSITKTATGIEPDYLRLRNQQTNPFAFGIGVSNLGYAYLQGSVEGVSYNGPIALNPNGGNVGIGTTTPTERLDVVGNGKFSGTVAVSGALAGSRSFFNQGGEGQVGVSIDQFYTNNKAFDLRWYGASIGSISNIDGSRMGISTVNGLDIKGGRVLIEGALTGTSATFSGKLNLSTSTATNVPLNIPYGVAPTTPVTGDIWRLSTGVRTQTFDGTNTKDYLFDKTNSVLAGNGNVSIVANNVGTLSTSPLVSYLTAGNVTTPEAYTISTNDFGANGFVNVFVSGNTTITLPTAAVMNGIQIRVIKTDGTGTTVTLSTGGTVTIKNHSIIVVSDGTNRIELL